MRGRRGRRDYRLSRSGPGAHPGRWRGAQRFSSSSFSPSSYPPNFSSSLTPFPLSLLLLLLSTPWGAHCPHPPSVLAQRFGESAAASLGHVHYGRPCLPSLCPQPQDHWGRVPGSRAPGGGRGTSPARRGSHGGAQAADPGLCPCALRTFFFVWTPSEAGPPPGRRRGRGRPNLPDPWRLLLQTGFPAGQGRANWGRGASRGAWNQGGIDYALLGA